VPTAGCQCIASRAICLVVNHRALQIFAALVILCGALRAASSTQATHALSLVDVNGNNLSTADGHVTILVLATTEDLDKARAVGDRVPDYCLGNPNYRMITVVRFTKKRGPILRKIATTVVKHRIDEEAKRLQTRYDEKKIARDAHHDIFVVTDFDGNVSSQLGESAEGAEFGVFVLNGKGEVLAQWHEVPSARQLAEVVK
jgi:hypothetical protein